jgi:hypothetical protein
MTGTLCQSAALGRIIAPWVGRTPEFFGIIVKTILAILEIVCAACRKAARRFSALRPGLSRLMMPPAHIKEKATRITGNREPAFDDTLSASDSGGKAQGFRKA